jgi:hypothetical protein
LEGGLSRPHGHRLGNFLRMMGEGGTAGLQYSGCCGILTDSNSRHKFERISSRSDVVESQLSASRIIETTIKAGTLDRIPSALVRLRGTFFIRAHRNSFTIKPSKPESSSSSGSLVKAEDNIYMNNGYLEFILRKQILLLIAQQEEAARFVQQNKRLTHQSPLYTPQKYLHISTYAISSSRTKSQRRSLGPSRTNHSSRRAISSSTIPDASGINYY